MKKTLVFLSSALFVAFMAVSCGNNTPEENADSVNQDSLVADTLTADTTAVAAEETAVATTKDEILSKAREAGQAKCNCYKTDAASVEKCFKSILEESYAAYKDDADFQKEMKAEYNKCIKEKASAKAKEVTNKAKEAGKEAANKAIKNGAEETSKAISNAFKK